MRIASVVLIALAALPSTTAQCTSLCADGGAVGDEMAVLPVPGVGNVPCNVAASVIPSAGLSDEECTLAQAGGYLVCDCATPPLPNSKLPCSFCSDGTLPSNPTATISPAVGLPSGGEISDCLGLVAYASLLQASDSATCSLIQSTYGSVCGCAPGGAVVPTTTVGAAVTTTTGAPEENTTGVATQLPETTSAVGEGTTEDTVLAEEPTASPAPSLASAIDSGMPSFLAADTNFPSANPPSSSITPFPTPFPTAEPTSDASISKGVLSTVALVIGTLVVIM